MRSSQMVQSFPGSNNKVRTRKSRKKPIGTKKSRKNPKTPVKKSRRPIRDSSSKDIGGHMTGNLRIFLYTNNNRGFNRDRTGLCSKTKNRCILNPNTINGYRVTKQRTGF